MGSPARGSGPRATECGDIGRACRPDLARSNHNRHPDNSEAVGLQQTHEGFLMDLHLQGRRALVTGSTAGIGFAAALGLAREGAEVVLNGRSQGRVDDAAARIRDQVPDAKVTGVAADLSGTEGCAALIQAIPQVDVLVNNVGIFEPKPFEEITDADWLRFFETNVMSGVRLSRHYLQGMRARDWGRIVFISSESGVHLPAEMIHSGMTKTAQLAVARGMAETTAGGRHREQCPAWTHPLGGGGHLR